MKRFCIEYIKEMTEAPFSTVADLSLPSVQHTPPPPSVLPGNSGL